MNSKNNNDYLLYPGAFNILFLWTILSWSIKRLTESEAIKATLAKLDTWFSYGFLTYIFVAEIFVLVKGLRDEDKIWRLLSVGRFVLAILALAFAVWITQWL